MSADEQPSKHRAPHGAILSPCKMAALMASSEQFFVILVVLFTSRHEQKVCAGSSVHSPSGIVE
eukprot:CAMPEP_0181194234 /NCGR_PEP_ID=MMETSP1096-20121128/14231_1 /TAXON_ID=156174 ORGANISM="Chrysochromulina ericina, Strain CCMP281" /NCGR_SAMPLE_ID=MMETSP1096 /ASSEMBLY_ACC=CAM_ASM_000453 /LENGTH=63 /DNA_ID=CAMNT_0023283729 /DNA_START=643 /DNA_END=831 /DNA_ORIENTATION=+